MVGLGNPGTAHERTRHNVGTAVVQHLVSRLGSGWTRRPLYKVARAEGLLLSVPLEYMNRSGSSVAALARDEGLPIECFLIVCDDVNLPLGRLRLRCRGGDGGHKGLRSIISVLGTAQFARLRLGVGKPSLSGPLDQYVLDRFDPGEESAVGAMIERASEAVVCWHREGADTAMARFNASGEERAT